MELLPGGELWQVFRLLRKTLERVVGPWSLSLSLFLAQCGVLDECPHKSWFPAGRTVWEGLGGVALLEEVCP